MCGLTNNDSCCFVEAKKDNDGNLALFREFCGFIACLQCILKYDKEKALILCPYDPNDILKSMFFLWFWSTSFYSMSVCQLIFREA